MRGLIFLLCILFWALMAFIFSGCSSTTGWRISFGVSPVTAIEENQKLQNKTVPVLSNTKY